MNHPITPPPKLVREWAQVNGEKDLERFWMRLATQAARWGDEQRLEACIAWLHYNYPPVNCKALRAAMHPKPPSLAEEGQRILVENGSTLDGRVELDPEDVATIRAALERLKELEQSND